MTEPLAAAGAGRSPANPEADKLAGYPLFDWLRFALASIVMLGHEAVPLPGPVDGGLAVAVFLALSGWLIGGILLRTGRAELPRFFFNRATRIWLPYLAAIAAIYGLGALRDGVNRDWLKYLFYDVTFTHYSFVTFPRALAEMPLAGTGNHFWSISVEEQFYLFAPLLMFGLAAGKRLVPWVLVAALLLAAGSRFAPIALGVIAAVGQRDRGDWHRHGVARWLIPVAAGAAFMVLWRWNIPQAQAGFAVLLVLACARPGPRGRFGLFLGAISYPLYLQHWAGFFAANAVAHHLAMPLAVRQALAAACGLGAGVLAWAAVDRPVMRLRADWFTPARGRGLGRLAYALVGVGLAGGTVIHGLGG